MDMWRGMTGTRVTGGGWGWGCGGQLAHRQSAVLKRNADRLFQAFLGALRHGETDLRFADGEGYRALEPGFGEAVRKRSKCVADADQFGRRGGGRIGLSLRVHRCSDDRPQQQTGREHRG